MCGCCFKTQFGNFKREWISSETCLLPLLEKSEMLPKLANLPTNELFVALDEGEFFSIKFFFVVWNSQLNTPTDSKFIRVRNITNDLLETYRYR